MMSTHQGPWLIYRWKVVKNSGWTYLGTTSEVRTMEICVFEEGPAQYSTWKPIADVILDALLPMPRGLAMQWANALGGIAHPMSKKLPETR